MAGSLMALIMPPLLMYVASRRPRMLWPSWSGGKGRWYGARLALFWALLASTRWLLLHGLVAGFIGPGPSLQFGVGLIWFAVFAWFWIAGLFQAKGHGKGQAYDRLNLKDQPCDADVTNPAEAAQILLALEPAARCAWLDGAASGRGGSTRCCSRCHGHAHPRPRGQWLR